MVTQASALAEASRPHLLSRPLGVAVVADRRRRARRAVCQEAQARRRASAPRTRSRRATASAGSWRAMRCARCRRSASPRSGWARAAARGWRAAIRGCSPRRSRCSSTSPASSAAEIMDAQRAIECLAAELAAENATDDDIARLRQLDRRRRRQHRRRRALHASSAREFHLAVAEASHNRVLVVQLISLQHVSWPRRNPTLTPKVMRRIHDVHKELLGADRNPRRRRRAPADGRPRQDDPRPPGVGARQGLSPFVPAKAADRRAGIREPTTRPLGSRLRGNERSFASSRTTSKNFDCC